MAGKLTPEIRNERYLFLDDAVRYFGYGNTGCVKLWGDVMDEMIAKLEEAVKAMDDLRKAEDYGYYMMRWRDANNLIIEVLNEMQYKNSK
jgi:hypothetical protein